MLVLLERVGVEKLWLVEATLKIAFNKKTNNDKLIINY